MHRYAQARRLIRNTGLKLPYRMAMDLQVVAHGAGLKQAWLHVLSLANPHKRHDGVGHFNAFVFL